MGKQGMAVTVACTVFFLMLCAYVCPEWLGNGAGMNGYMKRRSWGLFYVSGMQRQSHHQIYQSTLLYCSKLHVAAQCIQPLCRYYRAKATAYEMIMLGSYFCAFLITIALVLMGAGIRQLRHNASERTKWAITCFLCALLVSLSGIGIYIFMTDDAFESINVEAMYPVPAYSFGIFLMGFALMMDVVLIGLTFSLKGEQERAEGGFVESTDTDTDDEEKRKKAFLKKQQTIAQQQQYALQLQQQQEALKAQQQQQQMGMGSGMAVSGMYQQPQQYAYQQMPVQPQ